MLGTYVTLVKMHSHPEADPSTRQDPTTIVNNLVKSRGGKINCSAVTAGRFDLVVFAEFDSLEECLKAWLPAQEIYGWSTETLPGIPFEKFGAVYSATLKDAIATHSAGSRR